MSKIKFEFSKTALNRAGIALIGNLQEDHEIAKNILDNWRACHVSPLNSFQRSLRAKLNTFDESVLISQRLKRSPSIILKLQRQPKMLLSRMQDIGGIRAVVKDMQRVREIEAHYKNGTKIFSVVNAGRGDYVNYPKSSGYRSIHKVFKCKNGFQIELQIRTEIQHAWATAVETMGTFLKHSLKSSEGPDEWLKFFALASSAFAIIESTPRVPGHDELSDQKTLEKLIETEEELNVLNKLAGFRVAAKNIKNDSNKGKYHLITLDLDRMMARIRSFESKEIDAANKEYSKQEEEVRQGMNKQVVLVSSESISALKKAYPSYFLDSQKFSKLIEDCRKLLIKLSSKKK